MDKIKFGVRLLIKMIFQNIILPVAYHIYALKPVDERKVILADAHHNEIPYSMHNIKKYILDNKYDVEEFFVDFQKNSAFFVFRKMLYFMKIYAQAKYVFICDNFLPVSSCNKRKETIVVQLWHGGGLLKKTGYDTADDIPKMYRGNVYKNYSMVTVSAKCCIPVYERAMRQKKGTVVATGLSRTDDYFNLAYLEQCRKNFYDMYPDAVGKRIALWAPTFRGKAGNPRLEGAEDIARLENELGDEWKLIVKVHPHLEEKYHMSNCTIPTELLLAVADCLITDYSSIIFDYALFGRPIVLFVPDREEYLSRRGLYINLEEIPAAIVEDGRELANKIKQQLTDYSPEDMEKFAQKYMTYCDGKATGRIMQRAEELGKATT